MASALSDEGRDGVRYIPGEDGITAVDVDTGIASEGKTVREALSNLVDALELHEEGGDGIDDPDAFLEELGLEPMPEEPDECPF